MVRVKDCPTKTKSRIAEKLSNRYWRLNNLYWILNDQGEKVRFKLNRVQYLLYVALWWLNVILKSRQHGITTFVAVFFLDAAIFNSNVKAGIICHKLKDAQRIFRDKIKFAYDNLPPEIKEVCPTVKDDACEMIFANNSSIYVGVSMRSGTLQYLHISEYGWLCAHAAQQAREIKTGALETVHAGGIIIIESTAEGMNNDFHILCETAQTNKSKELTRMDYKFHFFPWYIKPENVLEGDIFIDDKLKAYFERVETETGDKIDQVHRNWYAKKRIILKQSIYKEHPSTPAEAFMASFEGAYFGHEMVKVKEDNRIGFYPWEKSAKVFCFWDLGPIHTAIWFCQFIQAELRWIECYYDNTGQGIATHAKMLQDKEYVYGEHWCGWDIDPDYGPNRKSIATGKTIKEEAAALGIRFRILDKYSFDNRIEAGRIVMDKCKFNKDTTQIGVAALINYRQSVNLALSSEDRTVFNNHPVLGPEVHIADAFTHGALCYIHHLYVDGVRMGRTTQDMPVHRTHKPYQGNILTRGLKGMK